MKPVKFLTSILLGTTCLVVPAFAQSDNASAEGTRTMNTVTVTAQKREQDILDVPLAVSAISGDALVSAQVAEISDLTRVSPSLTISQDGNKNQQTLRIRGIGTFSFSTSAEPTVSAVVDDVALLQPGQVFGQLTDIARVEVLRGPQGTLFGKNSSAGVLNIVTNDPEDELTGYVEGTLTTDDEERLTALLSGPIGENAGFRVSAFTLDREGYLNNLTTGNKINGEKAYGIRGKFTYGSGPFDLALTADYSDSDGTFGGRTYLEFPAGTTNGGRPVDMTGITPGLGNTNLRNNYDPVSDTDQTLLAAKINYDLGFATLTSITSFQEWNYDLFQDSDDSAGDTLSSGGPYNSSQVAQEFRLTSPSTDTLEYQLGLYYADGETDRSYARNAPGFLAFLRQNWASTATTETLAAFAQLGYDLTDKTKLTVGARISKEDIGVRFVDGRTTPASVFEGDDSDTAVTGRISLQHDLTEDVMVFGSVATGYKGQAYDISSGFNQGRADNPVGSESSINYEAGIKGRTSNGLLSYSAVAFLTEYDEFQAQGILNPGAVVPDFQLVNVGKLQTKGIELEGMISPAEGLVFSGSAAYIDATVEEYPDASCYEGQTVAEGCVNGVQDIAGEPLNNSPELKFNVAMSYERPVFGGFDGFLNVNYVWQDDVNFSLAQDPLSVQDAYGLANLNFGIRKENLEVTAFVNNVLDETYAAGVQGSGNYSNRVTFQQVPRDYERYAGIRVKAGF